MISSVSSYHYRYWHTPLLQALWFSSDTSDGVGDFHITLLNNVEKTSPSALLAQTNQALYDVICSFMNTINVIEIGVVETVCICTNMLLTQTSTLRRQIRKTSSSNTRSKTPGTRWSQYWRADLSIEWRQPCCRQNHSFCFSPVQTYPEEVSWEWPSFNHSYCIDRST